MTELLKMTSQGLQTRQPVPVPLRPLGRLPDVLPLGGLERDLLWPRAEHDG